MSDIVPPQVAVPKASSWWHRTLEPEHRQKILKDLAIQKPNNWELRFGIMLALSVVVAVMGLLLNSAAVVIGAMLLAPLMQPVLASAACLSMGLFDKAGIVTLRLIVASIGSVAIAYVLVALLPEQIGFTDEVLARTRPDGRDLIVALAAGAAGAYATVREDVSSSLPGVAVAVALVPPLGTLGVTAQVGDWERAWGAFLLYSTNLVAIILVGVFVFVLTGFVAPRRLETNYVKVGLAIALMSVLVALVGWPLIQASRTAAQDSRDDALALTIVEQWLSDTDTIDEVDVRDDFIRVMLRGTGQPPADDDLKANLAANFAGKETRVEWVQVGIPNSTTTTLGDEEVRSSEVRAVVESWIEGLDNARLDNFELDGLSVRVDASGTGTPPSVDELSELLSAELETDFEVRINWGESIAISTEEVDPLAEDRSDLNDLVAIWATAEDVEVDSVLFDGDSVTVVARGANQPSVDELQAAINERFVTAEEPEEGETAVSEVEDFPLSVLFSQQIELVG